MDREVLASIADAVSAAAPGHIVEIGPGLGAVTQVLASLAERVLALEIDPRLVEILQTTAGQIETVDVRQQDVLQFDFSEVAGDHPVFVVGSIPYRITAPILKGLIRQRRSISGALLITQSEVANKIDTSPGPHGTALGVFVQAYTDVALLRRIAKSAFHPVPDVDSMLWTFTVRSKPRFTAPPDVFFGVVRAICDARRKMIRGALRSILAPGQVAKVLDEAGIDETVRGETLGFAELDRLALAAAEHLPSTDNNGTDVQPPMTQEQEAEENVHRAARMTP